jgi:tetratricopeptide (TPR) repeat protein
LKSSCPLLLSLFLICSLTAGCAGKNLTRDREVAYQAYAAGDYARAAGEFEALVHEAPADADLWFRLGNSQARLQQPGKAVDAYRNALVRDPSLAKAWYNMGLIQLQEALKSFADMQEHVRADDPAALRGKRLRDAIISLLEGSNGDDGQKE